MMKVKHITLFFLSVFMAACAKAELASPAPTPQAIQVYYAPTMQFWANSLANCASNNSHSALYFFATYDKFHIGEDHIVLDLGQTTQNIDDAFQSQVGWEQLVIVVNVSNHTSQLSQEEIQQIFSGDSTKWGENQQLPIQVWSLPDDDPYTKVFYKTVLADHLISTEARLAPDINAMLEAISQNPGAIGFLPESTLNSQETSQTENLKIVRIPTDLKEELHQPVVAITQGEPEGLVRQLLVCLQDTGK